MAPPQPRRVLQLYSPQKQAEFAAFTAEDRLRWLDGIRALYWAADAARRAPPG